MREQPPSKSRIDATTLIKVIKTVRMLPQMEVLTKFRESLYNQLPARADALMNLLDALTSDGHIAISVVQLSESYQFKRKYSSITDAISNGLSSVDFFREFAVAELFYGVPII